MDMAFGNKKEKGETETFDHQPSIKQARLRRKRKRGNETDTRKRRRQSPD